MKTPFATTQTNMMRRAGIDVVGDIPWGTHFCLFYDTKADLLETLVSYCKAGLQSQEFCLWVVAPPVTREDALEALRQAVPSFDRYVPDGGIEIVPARDWYLQDGAFDLNRVIAGWNEALRRASARGYVGVRVTGDTAWLEKSIGRTSVNTKSHSTSPSRINAWRCCALTRLQHAEHKKSWM